MLRTDDRYLVVCPSGDGGDSAHFTGLHIIATNEATFRSLFFIKNGQVVRHPAQIPWNNPANATRDQIMPVCAGLARTGAIHSLRKILWRRCLAFGFAQNFDRDCVGTRKFPWPHFAKRCRGESRWVWFDFADPMFPHYLFAMAVGARLKPRWLFRALAAPTFVLDCLTYRWSDNDDQGALIASADLLGFIPLFRRLNPNWEEKCLKYFNSRGLDELGSKLVKFIREAR